MKNNTKICSKCGLEKDRIYFSKGKRFKDGLQTICKLCAKNYREVNKVKIDNCKKSYYENNKEDILKYQKDYYKVYKNNIVLVQKKI